MSIVLKVDSRETPFEIEAWHLGTEQSGESCVHIFSHTACGKPSIFCSKEVGTGELL